MSTLGLEQLLVQTVSNDKQEASRYATGYEGPGLAGPDELA